MSNNPNGTDGPKVKIKASCFDCRHCKSTGYAVQGDSGHAVSCSLVDKRIGDTTWDTPTWCPLLAAAVDAANGTCDARAEIARLTADLAAARAVPGDVEAALCDSSCWICDREDPIRGANLERVKAAIARAISDATAARGTVGGLLATAVVGNRIPQANWRQDPVSLTHRLIIGDFVLYVGKDWIVRRATDRGPAIVTSGSMPEPLAHGPETGAAGMIAAEDAAAELMSRGPLPKGG